MGLISYFNPIKAYQSASSLIKDVRNYLYYKNKVQKMVEQGLLSQLKARTDWFNRIYYVVNLEPETLLATGDIIDLEKSRVFDSVAKVQGRFADSNLVEIVEITTKRIKNDEYYAYLVIIKYRIISELTDLIRLIVFIGILWYAASWFHYAIQNFDLLQAWVIKVLTNK
jgi:hypothetical protein